MIFGAKWENPYGERSPTPLLRLSAFVTNQSKSHVEVTGASFSLYADDLALHTSRLPAVLRRSRAEPGQGFRIELPVPLSVAWIREAEDKRCGRAPGDLRVTVDVDYRLLEEVDIARTQRLLPGPPAYAQLQDYFPISRDRWLQLLRSLGYDEFEVLEVPVRKLRQHPEYKQAFSSLQKAQQLFRDGSWPEVVLRARVAVEELAHIAAESDEKNTAKVFQDAFKRIAPGDDNEARRSALGKIAHGLHDLRHPTAHGRYMRQQMDRVDAELALNVAISLFRYFGERLARPLEGT